MRRRLALRALSQVHHNPGHDNRDNDGRRYQPDRAPAAPPASPAVAGPTMANTAVASRTTAAAAAGSAVAVHSAGWHAAVRSRAASGRPGWWPVTVAPVLAIGVLAGHRTLPGRGMAGIGRRVSSPVMAKIV